MQFRLDIAYDGSDYVGWQIQPNGMSVQASIEKALSIVLRQKTKVLGSSRTDSGVHADQQVATFFYGNLLDLSEVRVSLNALLPKAIVITAIGEVPEEFHPIGSSMQKIYCYKIWNERKSPPKIEPYRWANGNTVDIALMEAAAAELVGEHDFRAFMASDGSALTTTRKLFEVKVCKEGHDISLWFSGNGFLKQMVRAMVGTLVEIGVARMPVSHVNTLLLKKDRTLAGPTAPAKGLNLVQINFDRIVPLDQIIH